MLILLIGNMQLSKNNLKRIETNGIVIPSEAIVNLPEKVLQFGTGVLLRALPDYFIDKANREGTFNGRVVAVKSTGNYIGGFDAQDSLYTLHLTGIENGKKVEESIICAAISRVLAAGDNWRAVLEVARSPELQLIISNTTEVGIQLVAEDVRLNPPSSFPGKLLAVLFERYKFFYGDQNRGLVIVPTELIISNGEKLRSVVMELAALNNLEEPFITWLETNNHFCNSLVDRIVPGHPSPEANHQMEEISGYQDSLSIIAESYCLWAIEGDAKVKEILSFHNVHKGVIITPDIEQYRELKLRLLNGSHTLCCAVAFLSGFITVKEAMNNRVFFDFISGLMYDEIIPAIPYPVDETVANDFATSVLDRFLNPGIAHNWISIATQYSTKMKTRVIPLLLNHYKNRNLVPAYIGFGFAAFIRFMHVIPDEQGSYKGNINGYAYVIKDDNAEVFAKAWRNKELDMVVDTILADTSLWGTDLSVLDGFRGFIINTLEAIMKDGIAELLLKITS